MGKNVLILSSSPRKNGNSEALCEQFGAGASEAGHQVETLSLSGKNITPCTACDACKKTGVCAKKDDMNAILERMIAADVIVMATPVYFYSMSAQMKTLIDRTYARYMEIAGKDFYFLLTAAVGGKSSLDRTVEGFRGFLDCLKGAREKGIVYGVGAWAKGDILKSSAMREAHQMGKTA